MSVLALPDAKRHLNITDDADDPLITQKIDAAEACVEAWIGKSFDTYYDEAEQAYSVPAPLLEAVRQLTAHFYENREATMVGGNLTPIPLGVFDLVGPYKAWAF